MIDKIVKWVNRLYKSLGWIDTDPNRTILFELVEQAKKDPDYAELAELYSTYETPEERKRAISVLRQLLSGEE